MDQIDFMAVVTAWVARTRWRCSGWPPCWHATRSPSCADCAKGSPWLLQVGDREVVLRAGQSGERHLSRLKLRPCRSPPTRVCMLGRCRGARDASRPQLVPCGHRRPGPPTIWIALCCWSGATPSAGGT